MIGANSKFNSVLAAPARSASPRPDLSPDYHYALVQLVDGPGRISPGEVKGLIDFPSFHGAMAVWYGRTLPYVRWPLVVWNILVLLATPIEGGHHVVDVLGASAPSPYQLL